LEKYKGIGKLYPVLGNHEGFPCDHIDVNSKGEKWQFEFLANLWKPWLTEESYISFKKYGRYSQLHPGTNLRIIVLNSFVQDATNSYTWINSTDIMGELIWLIDLLEKAEQNNEHVLLLNHFPPYNSFANNGIFTDQGLKK